MDMRTVNRAVSTIIPFVLLGLSGFCSYVFIGSLCIDHLIVDKKEKARGAGLIAGYVVVLVLFMLPYFRTVLTINLNPGYLDANPGPDGEGTHHRPKHHKKWHTSSKASAYKARMDAAKESPSDSPTSASAPTAQNSGEPAIPPPDEDPVPLGPVRPTKKTASSARTSLQEFALKDIYVCESDGLPRWCSHCNIWKPDRSHHSAEVGRCVRRMDHVCPWVGGVVGETSMKFFVQTVFYGMFYTVYTMVVAAVYIRKQAAVGSVNSLWIALLIISSAFGIFSIGMTASTIQLLVRNRTTIENIYSKSRVYFLAVHDESVSSPIKQEAPSDGPRLYRPVTSIQYPLPESHALYEPPAPGTQFPTRKFRVVKTEQGANPWQLDEAFDNVGEVMGNSIWEWWLPITRSPVEYTHVSRYNERFIRKLLDTEEGVLSQRQRTVSPGQMV